MRMIDGIVRRLSVGLSGVEEKERIELDVRLVGVACRETLEGLYSERRVGEYGDDCWNSMAVEGYVVWGGRERKARARQAGR